MGNVEKSGVLGGEGSREEETRPSGLIVLAVDHLRTTLASLPSLCGTPSFASLPHLFREQSWVQGRTGF